ncbi:PqiC family protein [Paraburkholderia bryophila]|uniref:PqiC family protein n=1 Tax=Paraburkholderia bryophila TaxID=420952 RepID=UPI0038BC1C00
MMFDRLPRSTRGLVRGAVFVGALAGVMVVAACSSPSSRFYTLGVDGSAGDVAAISARTSSATPAWLIEVAPVDVPPQVAKNQMVVQTGPTQVKVLEDERWASLPGDEIRRALSTSLTQQLNTIDVYGTARSDSAAVYRVSLNVQRFESWPGSHALIDAVWSVRAVRSNAVMTCRSVVSEPVGGGYDSLVDGHRKALMQVSLQVAAAVRSMVAASGAGSVASQSRGTGTGAGAGAGKNAVGAVVVPGCPSEPGTVAAGG